MGPTRPGSRVRQALVDSPTSLGARARLRRWQMFRNAFPAIETMRVLDLGGTVESWWRAPVRPRQVTVLNLAHPDTTAEVETDNGESWTSELTGDACTAAEVLAAAGVDHAFDLVFSNSLIEHVGGHARRGQLAREVRRLAPRHWVQTPYRYFPLEPHWLFPAGQFMPTPVQVWIARHWPLVHTRPDSHAAARESVLWTELVGITELRDYFPDSTIICERALGIPKSLIAMR